MQVERMDVKSMSGGRVSNTWVTYLLDGDNAWKRVLIPDGIFLRMKEEGKAQTSAAKRWARGALASWWGKGSPRRRCVADLRG